MRHIFKFLLFFVIYVGYSWASYALLKQRIADAVGRNVFWKDQLLALLSYAFFFCSLYVLAGLWNTKLVVFFVLAFQLAVFVSFVLRATLGSRTDKTEARSAWAGAEFALNHPFVMLVLMGVSVLVLIAFPVTLGVIYFRHPPPSPELTLFLVRAFVLLQFIGLVITRIVGVAVLASENLDENTRQIAFINQLTALVPISLWLAFALWAFGIGEKGLRINFGPVAPVFSVRMVLLLAIFFLVTSLLPYVIGTQRAKRWRVALLEGRRELLLKTSDILERPTAASYVPKLRQLFDELEAVRKRFLAQELLKLQEVEQANQTPDVQRILAAVSECRDLDPRFIFLDDLGNFQANVQEVIKDLETRQDSSTIDAATRWAKSYTKNVGEVDQEIELTKKSSPRFMIAIGATIAPIVSALFGEVAKAAWDILSASIAK